ncbi:MAG: hydrogenase subunit MbhD domain-containing protein [Kiritimatiellia bacterium]
MLEVAFVILLVLLVLAAAGALWASDGLTAVLILSVFSVTCTVVFAFLQAVDVAMAEAVIGAGLLTAIFVTALAKTEGRA